MKTKRRWRAPLLLLLFSLPLFFIGLQDTQSWGDDFAQYIKEGQNISQGLNYSASGFIYNPLNTEYAPPSYPPGFPMLLAPIIYFFGDSISAMLTLISALMVLLAFVLFYFYRPFFSERSAMWLALLSVYAASVLDLKWYVLSDLPLLFFSSLYLLLRRSTYVGFLGSLSLALLLAFSCLVRSQAILLVIAEALLFFGQLLSRKKEPSSSGQILCLFALIYSGLHFKILNGAEEGSRFYLDLFQNSAEHYWQLIKTNASYLFELLQSFFVFRTDKEGLYRFELLIGTLLALFFLVSLAMRLIKWRSLPTWYAFLLCLLILVLPVRQGLRYLLPLLPVFVLFTAQFAGLLVQRMQLKVPPQMLPLLCSLYLLFLLPKIKDKPYDANWTPYTPKDKAVFHWLKTHLDSSTIVVSTKPRALHLFTGLPTTIPAWMKTPEENTAFYKKHRIRHFLVRTDLDWDMIERYLRESGTKTDTLRITDSYTLFTAQKD